ncbi:hypothetical protein PHYBOEH_002551 [Phytophthora boehmeriae]|uniref:Fibronectin type-III domain-containing protein n=1 Tax=Phytophthora boehmeriae TaxID=109152 RepID=A0A8T1WUC4_9STRA|nr:hypothetical protein PHYBOEH_002551 [Phytophthora boehmeriae]
MQSKLNNLQRVVNGVDIQRSAVATPGGGYTWTITFLDIDDSFVVTPRDIHLTCDDPTTCTTATYDVTVTKVRAAVVPAACVGNRVIPAIGALNKGQIYNLRVSAYNVVGFGKPAVAPTPQKPMVVPGPPTAVTLAVYSISELIVIFSPPDDNGGDTITAYEVQWALDSHFTTPMSTMVNMMPGISAPYRRVISSLTTGTTYYVGVRARNSQGFGRLQQSVPDKEKPYSTPSAPTQVVLGITSPTMLTVGWAPPSNDGGDSISGYVVQWDVSGGFDSLSLAASTTVTVGDSAQRSYTITDLSPGTLYYVQVFAKNRGGLGTPQTSIPPALVPTIAYPGKPHALTVARTTVAGELRVTWMAPIIPFHGLPCAGTLQAPGNCPVVGATDMVFGGVALEKYIVQCSERSDFSNPIEVSSTGSAVTVLLTGLVSGKTYYVQVLAQNVQGFRSYFCRRANTQNLLCPDQQVLPDRSVVTGDFVYAAPL